MKELLFSLFTDRYGRRETEEQKEEVRERKEQAGMHGVGLHWQPFLFKAGLIIE